jgi:hypothetical protein
VAGKVELTPPRGACWGLCMVYSLQIAKVYCKLSLHHDRSRNRRRWVEFFGGLAEEENFSQSTNDSNFLPNILTTLKPIQILYTRIEGTGEGVWRIRKRGNTAPKDIYVRMVYGEGVWVGGRDEDIPLFRTCLGRFGLPGVY